MTNSQSHSTQNPWYPPRTLLLHGELDQSQPAHLRYAHGGTNQPPPKRSSLTREWSESHLRSNMHRTNHSTHAQRNDIKMWLTLCLDERFCNLSFGCLNSFVFICPGSQKTWPLITAWLLGKGGRGRRSPFYTFDKPETKFQRVKLMLMRLSSPT